jgi:hypothetical protein
MSISPNMTDAHLKALLDALPDEMDKGELCATTLTIYSAFIDDPAQIMSELVAMIYTFGQNIGMSRKGISLGLRASADVYDEDHRTQTKH